MVGGYGATRKPCPRCGKNVCRIPKSGKIVRHVNYFDNISCNATGKLDAEFDKPWLKIRRSEMASAKFCDVCGMAYRHGQPGSIELQVVHSYGVRMNSRELDICRNCNPFLSLAADALEAKVGDAKRLSGFVEDNS